MLLLGGCCQTSFGFGCAAVVVVLLSLPSQCLLGECAEWDLASRRTCVAVGLSECEFKKNLWGGGSGLERLLGGHERELLRQLKTRIWEPLLVLFEHFAAQAGRFTVHLHQQSVATECQAGQLRMAAPRRLVRDAEESDLST